MSQTRRLAAILAADVAGYSRLMRADEEGTLERLKALRRELLDPKIAEHRGRKNQHIRPLGEGPERFARTKHIGPFALVIGAAAHHRLARAEGAADCRHRVPWIGRVVEGSSTRVRQVAAERPIGMQVELRPLRLRQRPSGYGSPPSAMIKAP